MDRQTTDAPFEIETLLPDGVRYVLPVRQWGKFQIVSLVLKLLGMALFVGGGYSVASTIAEVFAPNNGRDWFALFSIPFTLPLFLIGLLLFAIGTFVRSGRNTITLQNGLLTTKEKAGPFHWSWHRSAADITGLSVHRAPAKVNDKPLELGPLAQLSFVKVDSSSPYPFILAPCYPYATNHAIAKDLGARLETNVELHEEPWEFAIEDPAVVLPKEPLTQPTGSDITFERFEDGLTLSVPPAGWKGTKGHGLIVLAWWPVLLGITGVFTFIQFSEPGKFVFGEVWAAAAVLACFAIFGGMLTIAAINMAFRTTILAVVDDTLMVLEVAPLRKKEREWDREQIKSIQVGHTGTTINNVPLKELAIRFHAMTKVGLLSSRNNEELRWIADLLTRDLRLGSDKANDINEDSTS